MTSPRNLPEQLSGNKNTNPCKSSKIKACRDFYFRKLSDSENDVCLLDVHYRETVVCMDSYEEFFKGYILDEGIRKDVLREDLYKTAVEKLGKLAYEEIFFFKPALCLGGGEDIKYVTKGNGAVHHQVLLQTNA